jgi:hypothetical protein
MYLQQQNQLLNDLCCEECASGVKTPCFFVARSTTYDILVRRVDCWTLTSPVCWIHTTSNTLKTLAVRDSTINKPILAKKRHASVFVDNLTSRSVFVLIAAPAVASLLATSEHAVCLRNAFLYAGLHYKTCLWRPNAQVIYLLVYAPLELCVDVLHHGRMLRCCPVLVVFLVA